MDHDFSENRHNLNVRFNLTAFDECHHSCWNRGRCSTDEPWHLLLHLIQKQLCSVQTLKLPFDYGSDLQLPLIVNVEDAEWPGANTCVVLFQNRCCDAAPAAPAAGSDDRTRLSVSATPVAGSAARHLLALHLKNVVVAVGGWGRRGGEEVRPLTPPHERPACVHTFWCVRVFFFPLMFLFLRYSHLAGGSVAEWP